MPIYKVGRPVYRVKKSYRLVDQAIFRHGTIALIERNRKCQEIDETSYAVIGTRSPLILKSSILNPLPAADQSGQFGVPMRNPHAWFSELEVARSIFGNLATRRRIPSPDWAARSKPKRTGRRRSRRRSRAIIAAPIVTPGASETIVGGSPDTAPKPTSALKPAPLPTTPAGPSDPSGDRSDG